MLLDCLATISLMFLSLFQPFKIPDNASLSIKGSYHMEDITIEYGQLYYVDDDIDAIILIKDSSSMVVQSMWIYDHLGIESFNYVADIGNQELIIACDRYQASPIYNIPLYLDTLLIRFSLEGLILDTMVLPNRPKNYHNHHHMLVIEQSDGSMRYMDESFAFHDQPSIETTFVAGNAMIQFQGQATVNGLVSENLYFDWPGYYDIVISDKTYRFTFSITVEPNIIIEGDEENGVYVDDVTIQTTGTILLNDEHYASGMLVEEPGHYRLTIVGENDYTYTKDFTLMPRITFNDGLDTTVLTNDMQISSPMTIYSNGLSMLLNDRLYQSEEIIETGHYILKVFGHNQMCIEIAFDILPRIEGIEDQGVYRTVDIYVFGEARINDALISGSYQSHTPGHYVLELLFEGEVYEVIEFEIESPPETASTNPFKEPWISYFFGVIVMVGVVLILRKK